MQLKTVYLLAREIGTLARGRGIRRKLRQQRHDTRLPGCRLARRLGLGSTLPIRPPTGLDMACFAW